MPGTHNAAALMYEGSWETTSLMRDLTAVSDRPNDSFIESHVGSLPVFRPEGLRHVLPYYMAYPCATRSPR